MLVVALLGVAGCDTSHKITGSIKLSQSDMVQNDLGTCSGTGGYADISDGTEVVVKNEAGTILGKGGLRWDGDDAVVNECVWTFEIPGVADAPFYELEIGRRDAPTYSRAEMEASGWTVDLTIGD